MRFTFFNDFLALVFPETCCVCKRSLFDFENQLCRVCQAKLPLTTYHLRPQNNDLAIKIMGLTKAGNVMAFLRFTKKGMSQRLLHQLKYRNKPELGQVLGKLYGQRLKQSGIEVRWDFIIAVPLHPLKEKRRGYNQSLQFALGLASPLNIPIDQSLVRTKFTVTQTKKSRIARIENVEKVFGLTGKTNLEGKTILLVDDVMTTGATLSACANVLLDAGARQVDLAVIAAGR
ncbi:ComF family protein [Echinicola sp. 20G]|uniref:ComF family protein n=1 Tax=Echinicola sp. 20G TaxID=2781961 RepID=UPI0019102803|nr:ComF family protein [Echinicola sp. 20G]